jgi:hypothetical protein
MTTPPSGEHPSWRPGPDESPTTPQPHPGAGSPEGAGGWGAPASGAPAWTPPGQQPGYAPPTGQPTSYGQQPAFGPPSGQPSPYGPGYGQPSYGPPPGWPSGPPPKRRDRKRTALIAALIGVALLIVAGVALLVYVLSSTILDRSAVEQAVSQQFEERNGVALDLECKHRMIVRKGADYDCEGTTAEGEEIEIEITITNSDGAYTWAEKD